MIVENPVRTEKLILELTSVWEASVKATHTFLKEEDIFALIPSVKAGLEGISNLIVAYEGDQATGFMGIEDQKIEMLFLKPTSIGKGLGKKLILKAMEEYHVLYVDVNEQNPKALAFYTHFGFMVFERTALDEQGNPFPILKLKKKE